MSPAKRACVLIVEDEALLLDIVATEVEEEGISVIRALTAEAALEVLEGETPIDLLFTDIRLPGPMNGFRLAEKARQLRQQLPILFATGYTDESPKGVDGSCFFRKPYRIPTLVAKIKMTVENP